MTSNTTLKHVLTILLVCGTVMLTGLGVPRLWDRDEPRNAGCAREMLERLDWIVPTFNGELRAHKPVLLYWCIMAAYSLGGVNEFTARLPSALCAIGSALATYGIGRRLFNPTIGLWSGIVLATSLMFGVAGRAATPDSLLIFCVTLTMLVYVLFAFPSNDGSYFPRVRWQAALIYGTMGLAVLAKGPVGLVLPTAIIGMFLLIQRLPASEVKARPPRKLIILLRDAVIALRDFAPLHFLRTCWAMRPLLAIGVVLLVAAPWYIAVGVKTDGAFLREFFLTHNLDRATSSMEGHRGGPWYYPLAILVGFFPWSIFAIPLFLETAYRLRKDDPHKVGYVFASCWVGVWVGVFSLAGTKLPSYVTPCYPAIALLTGCFIYHLQQGSLLIHRYWLPASFATLGAAGVGLCVGIPLATREFLPGEAWLGLLGIIPLTAAAVAAISWHRQMKFWPAPLVAAAGGIVVVGILALGAYRADQHRVDQQLVTDWAKASSSESPCASYGVLEPSWVFYSHHAIPQIVGDPIEIAHFFRAYPHASLLTRERLVSTIRQEFEADLETVASAPQFLKREQLVILRRKPGAISLESARASQGKKTSH
ncbi:MAG: glycosyltransferase family 39 protein [Planctomycetales bacterium]|nr:glycosyltransferase family 39 protein [Planctomycetales bacterium]